MSKVKTKANDKKAPHFKGYNIKKNKKILSNIMDAS
jgi:hypothetical protein